MKSTKPNSANDPKPSDARSSDPRLADFLCFAIYSTNLAYGRAYKPILEELGLTYTQYIAIVALWEQDNQTVSSLGEKLFLESNTLTPILKKLEGDESAYFAVMIVVVVVASSLAQVIQLPDIVGAFLSGLALNAAVKEKEPKKNLEFIGNSLFIPIFFITTGFLIDPRALAHSLASDLPLVLSIIGALVVGKFAAAEITGRMYGYTRDERLTIWSLTLPQVAATLAAALVAFKTLDRAGNHLLDNRMLNVVLALMLSTSILGPVLTERFAPRLQKEKATPTSEQEPPISSAA
jgi:Kef-type K+ transport system membrane component KefB